MLLQFRNLSRKFLILVALIGLGFFNLLLGPSELLNLTSHLYYTYAGLATLGIFQQFILLPIFGEIRERLQLDLNISQTLDLEIFLLLNDKVWSLYFFVYNSGCFLSPIVGTFLYNNFGFRKTCEFMALTNLGYAIIIFLFNCGLTPFKEDRLFKEKLKVFKEKDCLLDKGGNKVK